MLAEKFSKVTIKGFPSHISLGKKHFGKGVLFKGIYTGYMR